MKQLKQDALLAEVYARTVINEQVKPQKLDYDDKEMEIEGRKFFIDAKFNYKRKAIYHKSTAFPEPADVYADVPEEIDYLKAYEVIGDYEGSKEITDPATLQMISDYVLDEAKNDSELYKDESFKK